MKIAIAGPYSADTEEKRQENLNRLNSVASEVYLSGHTPFIGVNAALPVVANLPEVIRYKAIMDISLALVSECDALILVAESPGANIEKDLMLSLGKPVFSSFAEFLSQFTDSN
jgi:hypothetical protein